MTTTTEVTTPRWNKFQGLSSRKRCGICNHWIKDDEKGIAVYDDTRRSGSLIHTDYYHDTCKRCSYCQKPVFENPVAHFHTCPARHAPRVEDGVVAALFGGEKRGVERDAFEDQVMVAIGQLLDAAPYRYTSTWYEWRYAMSTLGSLFGTTLLTEITYPLYELLRQLEAAEPRTDRGEEGYRVGFMQGIQHINAVLADHLRTNRSVVAERIRLNQLPDGLFHGRVRSPQADPA